MFTFKKIKRIADIIKKDGDVLVNKEAVVQDEKPPESSAIIQTVQVKNEGKEDLRKYILNEMYASSGLQDAADIAQWQFGKYLVGLAYLHHSDIDRVEGRMLHNFIVNSEIEKFPPYSLILYVKHPGHALMQMTKQLNYSLSGIGYQIYFNVAVPGHESGGDRLILIAEQV